MYCTLCIGLNADIHTLTRQVVEFFTKVSKATQELEPAAQIYKWYKVDGKDQFVYIEQ